MKKSRKLDWVGTILLLVPFVLFGLNVLNSRLHPDQALGGVVMAFYIIGLILPICFILAFIFYFWAATEKRREQPRVENVSGGVLHKHVDSVHAVTIIFVVLLVGLGWMFLPLFLMMGESFLHLFLDGLKSF